MSVIINSVTNPIDNAKLLDQVKKGNRDNPNEARILVDQLTGFGNDPVDPVKILKSDSPHFEDGQICVGVWPQ